MNISKGLFLILILLTACQSSSNEAQQISITQEAFFDLKGYFNQEIKRLNASQPKGYKTVFINEKSEKKQLDKLDYARELDIFIQADINRVDWIDKYRIDSTFQNSQLSSIEYKALDEDLRTRHIAIQFQNGNISKIGIANGGKSMAAGSQQQLIYEPSKGYQIESIQHTTFSKDKIFKIDVKFE